MKLAYAADLHGEASFYRELLAQTARSKAQAGVNPGRAEHKLRAVSVEVPGYSVGPLGNNTLQDLAP